jgi:hypothetical protein
MSRGIVLEQRHSTLSSVSQVAFFDGAEHVSARVRLVLVEQWEAFLGNAMNVRERWIVPPSHKPSSFEWKS